MPDQRLLLTDKSVEKLPLATEGQYFVRDTELRGFLILIGKRTKTFMAQGEFWRDGKRQFSSRLKLGECGEITTRDARVKAKEALASIAKGIRPGEAATTRSDEVTLREAWGRYHDAHLKRKGRHDKTIQGYKDHVERLFEAWLDVPLGKLGRNPKLVADRHDEITEQNGPYMANNAMRTFRAIYNHALKSKMTLPARNPTIAIDWNREARRDTGLGPADLPAWLAALLKVANPIRREFHLFSLLSGSRPDALRRVRMEHIDFRQRILHFPTPKGGAKKAFDIPLSRAMMRSIIRAMRAGRALFEEEAEFWLFPARSNDGHLIEYWENRKVLPKWGNDLRQSYRTLAQAAGLSEIDIHLLMNHSLPGVNAGYITRERLLNNHLRKQQERISIIVLTSIEKAAPEAREELRAWLCKSNLTFDE